MEGCYLYLTGAGFIWQKIGGWGLGARAGEEVYAKGKVSRRNGLSLSFYICHFSFVIGEAAFLQ
jgi:hypothetical protein